MFNRIQTLALAGLVAFGALAAVPATAQADSFYFGIGGGRSGPDIEFRVGDRDRGGPRWDRPGRPAPHHWDRPGRPGAPGCSAREAVRKAERMGIRRAHVRGENRRVIEVAGRDRGRFITLAFAKVPGCPVIR